MTLEQLHTALQNVRKQVSKKISKQQKEGLQWKNTKEETSYVRVITLPEEESSYVRVITLRAEKLCSTSHVVDML